ncbi:MAG: hypothetical protein ACRDQ2_01500 [Gaiellales bacterium]
MTKIADTSLGGFMGDVLNNCLRELPGGKLGVDMNLLIQMCKAEPKSAQAMMQLLAGELAEKLDGRPVAEASGIAMSHRLVVGALFAAYNLSRGFTTEMAPELRTVVELNPLVLECAEFVLGDEAALRVGTAAKRRRFRLPRRR